VRFSLNLLKVLRKFAEKTDKGKCSADPPVKYRHGPKRCPEGTKFLENAMRNATGSKRRESTKVRRAQASFVAGSELPAVVKNEPSAVRVERVRAVKAKISSVGYDLDTDFRKAMHKLLEDFGA
jgi:anti-sigma28 factor (negative regulator of flagellin synthesis)